jgi:hypothetical protein
MQGRDSFRVLKWHVADLPNLFCYRDNFCNNNLLCGATWSAIHKIWNVLSTSMISVWWNYISWFLGFYSVYKCGRLMMFQNLPSIQSFWFGWFTLLIWFLLLTHLHILFLTLIFIWIPVSLCFHISATFLHVSWPIPDTVLLLVTTCT